MDSMQIAYQEFMVGKTNRNVPISPKERNHTDADIYDSSRKRSGYRQILRALQGRVEEWSEIDRKLDNVLQTIANLRNRIYWQSCQMENQQYVSNEKSIYRHQQQTPKEKISNWSNSGFRMSLSNQYSGCDTLFKEDIRLALNHDLLQHERMLSVLRSCVSSLAQTVDEIGRRLDEWMIQKLEYQYDIISTESEFAILEKEQNSLGLAQEIYSKLALDLYRKQKMTTLVFDSCHDGLFGGDGFRPKKSILKLDPRSVMTAISDGRKTPTQSILTRILVKNFLLIP